MRAEIHRQLSTSWRASLASETDHSADGALGASWPRHLLEELPAHTLYSQYARTRSPVRRTGLLLGSGSHSFLGEQPGEQQRQEAHLPWRTAGGAPRERGRQESVLHYLWHLLPAPACYVLRPAGGYKSSPPGVHLAATVRVAM